MYRDAIAPRRLRLGRVSGLTLLVVCSLLAVGLLFYLALALRPESKREFAGEQELNIYCAAGIAKPVQEVLDAHNREFGTRFKLARTGGSGELAGQIKTEFETGVEKGADLYVTADPLLLDKARAEGIVAERFELAEQRPVVAVRSEASVSIESFQALAKSDIRFGIASERAAVGKMVRQIAKRDGFLEELESRKVTEFENVMTLAQALVTGSIDAALTWDTTVQQINRQSETASPLRVLCRADPQDRVKSSIGIGVLTQSRNPALGLRLARYLTAPGKAKPSFEKFGFTFLGGDHWAEKPEIHLYCGSMFTPVIEESVREFARRESINLYPKWEGCGKLVTRMKTASGENRFPDAYFACDEMFLERVQEHFQQPILVSNNEIVIAIRKELDTVREPRDLLDSQLRIGICDPEQSALGTLTRLMLNEKPYEGWYSKIATQAAVVVDVGPTLVSQLAAGGLDAAIVYRSNIEADPATRDKIRILELDRSSRHSVARQPWAVSRTTRYPRLMNRMFEWIQRDQNRKRFEEFGFKWVSPDRN